MASPRLLRVLALRAMRSGPFFLGGAITGAGIQYLGQLQGRSISSGVNVGCFLSLNDKLFTSDIYIGGEGVISYTSREDSGLSTIKFETIFEKNVEAFYSTTQGSMCSQVQVRRLIEKDNSSGKAKSKGFISNNENPDVRLEDILKVMGKLVYEKDLTGEIARPGISQCIVIKDKRTFSTVRMGLQAWSLSRMSMHTCAPLKSAECR